MKIKLALILIIISFTVISCGKHQESKNLMKLSDDNFAEKTAEGVLLVDFWATWCMPCRAQAPTISALADESNGKYKVGKVDVDECPSSAARFGIQSIPTMIIFVDGKEAERFVGLQAKGNLESALEKYVKK